MRLFHNDSTIGAYSLKKSHYSTTSGISVVLNDHPKYILPYTYGYIKYTYKIAALLVNYY